MFELQKAPMMIQALKTCSSFLFFFLPQLRLRVLCVKLDQPLRYSHSRLRPTASALTPVQARGAPFDAAPQGAAFLTSGGCAAPHRLARSRS